MAGACEPAGRADESSPRVAGLERWATLFEPGVIVGVLKHEWSGVGSGPAKGQMSRLGLPPTCAQLGRLSTKAEGR